MSGYDIRILDTAAQELAKVDKTLGQRIIQRIYWLAENLDSIHLERLSGDLAGFYKLRVGDYRVVYEILWAEHLILIHAIDHRSRIYRKR